MKQRTVAIFSPLGQGQLMVGAWNRPWSPIDMIRANPRSHGFRVPTRDERSTLDAQHGDMMPESPGEWSVLTDGPVLPGAFQ